jgi:hypothetical protein
MAKEQYIKIYDRVCAEQHFNICKGIGAKLSNELSYEYLPKLVETNHEAKVTI